MEVGVRVETEDILSGKLTHTASAYLTFVALGDDFKPVAVPSLDLKTASEQRRNREAHKRRESRLAEKRSEKICQENIGRCSA
jgi:acyl-CoA hydrolase